MGGSSNYKDGCLIPNVTISNSGKVTKIEWNGQGLNGSISEAIGNLGDLEWLDVGINDLRGRLPKEIGKLGRLKRLSVHKNNLSGEIPPEIGNLTELRDFRGFRNQFSGSIPKEFGKLTKLERLAIFLNKLSGSIPPEIGNLAKLGILDLGANQLNGNIPKELGELKLLGFLGLHKNQLTGKIPEELKALKFLKNVFFSDNYLTEMPKSLSKALRYTNVYLFPNPIQKASTVTYVRSAAAGFTALDWSILFNKTDKVASKKSKRSQSSNLGKWTPQELYNMCPLNNMKDSTLPAGCVAGIYQRFCRDPRTYVECQNAYDSVLSQSYFAPLKVCAAWYSGPYSADCKTTMQDFRVLLPEGGSLGPSIAEAFVTTLLANPNYARCPLESCKWNPSF